MFRYINSVFYSVLLDKVLEHRLKYKIHFKVINEMQTHILNMPILPQCSPYTLASAKADARNSCFVFFFLLSTQQLFRSPVYVAQRLCPPSCHHLALAARY